MSFPTTKEAMKYRRKCKRKKCNYLFVSNRKEKKARARCRLLFSFWFRIFQQVS